MTSALLLPWSAVATVSTRLRKPHAKCHYYCTRTIASVSSVPCVTENRDISVVFLSFWGSKENVVLSGVQDLVLLPFVECSDCETSLLASCEFVMQRLLSETAEKVLFQ